MKTQNADVAVWRKKESGALKKTFVLFSFPAPREKHTTRTRDELRGS
jgi:hypothetical protein